MPHCSCSGFTHAASLIHRILCITLNFLTQSQLLTLSQVDEGLTDSHPVLGSPAATATPTATAATLADAAASFPPSHALEGNELTGNGSSNAASRTSVLMGVGSEGVTAAASEGSSVEGSASSEELGTDEEEEEAAAITRVSWFGWLVDGDVVVFLLGIELDLAFVFVRMCWTSVLASCSFLCLESAL